MGPDGPASLPGLWLVMGRKLVPPGSFGGPWRAGPFGAPGNSNGWLPLPARPPAWPPTAPGVAGGQSHCRRPAGQSLQRLLGAMDGSGPGGWKGPRQADEPIAVLLRHAAPGPRCRLAPLLRAAGYVPVIHFRGQRSPGGPGSGGQGWLLLVAQAAPSSVGQPWGEVGLANAGTRMPPNNSARTRGSRPCRLPGPGPQFQDQLLPAAEPLAGRGGGGFCPTAASPGQVELPGCWSPRRQGARPWQDRQAAHGRGFGGSGAPRAVLEEGELLDQNCREGPARRLAIWV